MEKLEVKEWIERESGHFLEDIIELIKIPSVSREDTHDGYRFGKPCHDVLEKVIHICDSHGFGGGVNHEDYCATVLWEGMQKEEIGIFAHMDVVPEGTGWQYEPYNPVIDHGLIIGRGSSDNKGPAMSALYALKYLKESGWQPKHSIRIFFGSNEECGMKDVEYFAKHMEMPVFSFTPDASFPVCHGEKGVLELEASYDLTGSKIIEFHAGVASNAVPGDAYAILDIPFDEAGKVFCDKDCVALQQERYTKISVKGIAAHAAFPEGSDSAEVKLACLLKDSGLLDSGAVAFLNAVCALFGDYYGAGIGTPYEDKISGKITHVGGMVRTVNGLVLQNINIRYPISSNQEVMIESMKQTLTAYGFTMTKVNNNPPCYMDSGTPVIQALTQICNHHLGIDASPYVMGGGTYARKLKNAVGYGPGIPGEESVFGSDRGKGHQPDEYAKIEKLKQAVEIYAEAIPVIDELV